MTEREAAIVALFTGRLIGTFDAVQRLASELAGREIWTHELGSGPTQKQLVELARPLFCAIKVETGEAPVMSALDDLLAEADELSQYVVGYYAEWRAMIVAVEAARDAAHLAHGKAYDAYVWNGDGYKLANCAARIAEALA